LVLPYQTLFFIHILIKVRKILKIKQSIEYSLDTTKGAQKYPENTTEEMEG
jgi:hypothetical protein